MKENVSLRPYNTFGLDASARYFVEIDSEEALTAFLMDNIHHGLPLLVLGGGSNMLLTKDVEGIVLKNSIVGITVVREDAQHVDVRVGAGESWHGFVQHCLARNWGGVENLALIPGNVGASPIQNIGAYGVELKDVCLAVEALHIQTVAKRVFSAQECAFGYRDSFFKREGRGQYVITQVVFRLNKPPHSLHTGYGDIKQLLPENPTIQAVGAAVVAIRQSKLPDPAVLGNCGSFFKNPVIAADIFTALQARYPAIPSYHAPRGVKVPAAWLIEQCGWKGKRLGNYGVHDRQALVLVNYGGATGQEIYQLSSDVVASVQERFGIALEREVNII